MRTVAAAMGLAVQADPEPLRNRFIRSDQYSFIRQGVPALALKVGYTPDSRTRRRMRRGPRSATTPRPMTSPSRSTGKGAAMFNGAAGAAHHRRGGSAERPRWNDESFFKRFAPSQ